MGRTKREVVTQQPVSPAEAMLVARIRDRSAVVAVVGLGYVGLPLVDALLTEGFRVIGIDSDAERVRRVLAGDTVLGHLGDELFQRISGCRQCQVTSNFDVLADADVIVVCVPTPLTSGREPDLSHVVDAGHQIGQHLKVGQLIILESTTYPGTTRGPFLRSIESSVPESQRPQFLGSPAEPGWFVAHAPEREDPGRSEPARRSIPRLVGGIDPGSTRVAREFYGTVCDAVVPVESAEVAEAAKVLENTYRAVNIALVNEMKMLLEPLGIDIWSVVNAAATKPFGYAPFYPGPGTGGHCIPVDPVYLSWMARQGGTNARLIDSAVEVNRAVPGFVVEQCVNALAARSRPISGARILVVGLAYKPDLDDTRESPSFDLIARFEGLGATVSYHDPYIPHMPVNPHNIAPKQSVMLDAEFIRTCDALVIATAHHVIDWELVARHAPLVIDTRASMRRFADTMGERLVHA